MELLSLEHCELLSCDVSNISASSRRAIIYSDCYCIIASNQSNDETISFCDRSSKRIKSNPTSDVILLISNQDVSYNLSEAFKIHGVLKYENNRNKVNQGSSSFQIRVTWDVFLDIYFVDYQSFRRVCEQINSSYSSNSTLRILPHSFYGSSSTPNNKIQTSKRNADTVDEIKVMRIFSSQRLAFRAFDCLPSHDIHRYKLFSFEAPQTGKRQFLLVDYQKFIKLYFQLSDQKRHLYELIRESFPCRVYFDVEYMKSIHANRHIDGDLLMKKWIQLVLWKIFEVYGILLGWEHVLVLDSSTDEKYSKHVHIHCLVGNNTFVDDYNSNQQHKEYLFVDNREIGQFIMSILSDMTEPIVEQEGHTSKDHQGIVLQIGGVLRRPRKEYEEFWVISSITTTTTEKDKSADEVSEQHELQNVVMYSVNTSCNRTFFVDLGVYTRNRAFRLYRSCKFGKQKCLELNAQDVKVYTLCPVKELAHNLTSLRECVFNSSLIIPHDILSSENVVNTVHNNPSMSNHASPQVANTETNEKLISPIVGEQTTMDATDPYKLFKDFLRHFNTDKYQLLPRLFTNTNGLPLKISNQDQNHFDNVHLNAYSTGYRIIQQTSQSHPTSNNNLTNQTIVNSKREIARSHSLSQSSPFPQLDQYITCTVARRGGIQGCISQWFLFYQSNGDFPIYKLRYHIAKNRYCMRIQRSHKSNGIFFVVNLMNREITQGCWDVDCRGFTSEPITISPLLLSVLPEAEYVKEIIEALYNIV